MAIAFSLVLPTAGGEGNHVDCATYDAATGAATACKPIEPHNPILPATSELLWGIGAFAVLLVLMMKFGVPAAKKAMDDRTAKIEGDLEAAESTKVEAQGILAEYQRQLADAKAESNRIIEASRVQAEKVKTDLVAAAQAEVNDMKVRASADIESARAQAMASIQGSIGGLVIELAEKVVEKNLDKSTNQALIDSFIAKVGS